MMHEESLETRRFKHAVQKIALVGTSFVLSSALVLWLLAHGQTRWIMFVLPLQIALNSSILLFPMRDRTKARI
jgi:hypothetical protein